MTIKLKQRILLQAINIHRYLVKEIKIEFSENGLRIFSVDPAYCEMVITTIPKTACEEYNMESNLEIGIDIQKIKDYLRLFKKDDVLTFDYDPENNRLLGKEGNLTRGMGLLDMAGWSDPKIPKVDLKNKVSINTKIFYDSLKGIISNKNYEQTYITTIRDSLILENYDEDEDHDKFISDIGRAVASNFLDMWLLSGCISCFQENPINQQIFDETFDWLTNELNNYMIELEEITKL